MKVVIIGGVAGGASAAARLRRLDEQAQILIFERGDFVSFANCGLPYFLGGVITDRDELLLQTPESFKRRFNVDVHVNSEVLELHPETKTVTVRGPGGVFEESWDALILAPGAAPTRPKLPGLEREEVFTLRNIPDMDRIEAFLREKKPRRAVLCGGGYIGLEMAENLMRRGVGVTIVQRPEQILKTMDADMARELEAYMLEKGVTLLTGASVQGIEAAPEGVAVQTSQGAVEADFVLFATGVTPETQLAARAGLRLGAKGSIAVDAHMRTSAPDIYAVGDAVEVTDFVTGAPANVALAGPANKQGRIAADNICGLDSRYAGAQGTAIVQFFEMTAASTGLNEKAARAAGIDYDKTYTYQASHAGYYPGARNLCIKILWEKSSLRLLGAQIVGFEGVDKRMDVLATAIRLGAKAPELAELELAYAPPFGSAKDPVNFAGFIAENVSTGKLRQFFWHDVDALPRDGSVALLDVRFPGEYARGHIEGFVNIQLDELRQNLHRIPPDKPVYVHCHSGLRSYIACRILTGNGYLCYNLAGGWRFYNLVKCRENVPGRSCFASE